MEHGPVCAAVTPAPVHEARAHPPEGAAAVTAIAVHRDEDLLALGRRLAVAAERIGHAPRRGRGAPRRDVGVVAERRRETGRPPTGNAQQEHRGYYGKPKTQTIPPWLVCRARWGAKSARGRTSAGSSERTSPDKRNQSPPIPAYTATYCRPSGPL